MEVKLDLKDIKLLYELDANCRQKNSEIAKKVRLSKDAVGYRIKKLEEGGLIRGYRAVIDSSSLGYSFYRVFFNLMDIQPRKLKEMINFLVKRKNVWWIARLDGAWNFAFAIWVKSNKEFQEFYYDLGQSFRANIKEKLICPMVRYQNFSKKYLLADIKENTFTTIGEGEKVSIDNIDNRIIRVLSENARTSLIDIAHDLSMDSMTVFHRIKKLEKKKIIQGYKVDLDISKLKRDFYSVKINLNDVNRLEEIKKNISGISQVVAMTEAIGSYDIEFDLEVENSEQYYEVIEMIENRFSDIREIKYFRILENHKILYMPED